MGGAGRWRASSADSNVRWARRSTRAGPSRCWPKRAFECWLTRCAVRRMAAAQMVSTEQHFVRVLRGHVKAFANCRLLELADKMSALLFVFGDIMSDSTGHHGFANVRER